MGRDIVHSSMSFTVSSVETKAEVMALNIHLAYEPSQYEVTLFYQGGSWSTNLLLENDLQYYFYFYKELEKWFNSL